MNKKRVPFTPQDMNCKICDPDFLDGEGNLIFTSSKGKSKEFGKGHGKIKINYTFEKPRFGTSRVSISFIKSRSVVGSILFAEEVYNKFSYSNYQIRTSNLVMNVNLLMNVSREKFIQSMIEEYPEVGLWILWNV